MCFRTHGFTSHGMRRVYHEKDRRLDLFSRDPIEHAEKADELKPA